MEHTNFTNSECQNGYSIDTFYSQFGINDKEVKTCCACKYFEDNDGIYVCTYFSNQAT